MLNVSELAFVVGMVQLPPPDVKVQAVLLMVSVGLSVVAQELPAETTAMPLPLGYTMPLPEPVPHSEPVLLITPTVLMCRQ